MKSTRKLPAKESPTVPPADSPSTALTVVEVAKLENLEIVIEKGLRSFLDVGRSLTEIQEGQLYRATHATFEAYLSERWGLSKTRGYELIGAAGVANDLSAIADTLPANEAQARPLAKLPRAERAAAWQEAQATAPNGEPTGAHVRAVVEGRLASVERLDATEDCPTDGEGEPDREQIANRVRSLCGHLLEARGEADALLKMIGDDDDLTAIQTEAARLQKLATKRERSWCSSKNRKVATATRGFAIPTVDEVAAYCAERANHVDASNFVDFYTSKGWLVGKAKMKDWRAAVRTWEKNGINNRRSFDPADPRGTLAAARMYLEMTGESREAAE